MGYNNPTKYLSKAQRVAKLGVWLAEVNYDHIKGTFILQEQIFSVQNEEGLNRTKYSGQKKT